jgi:Sugar (and other) transporter
MVGLRKIEDRPTPPCVYNFRVYMCSVVAACAAIMIGYDSAFIGGTIVLPSFEKEFGLNKKSAADLNFISANIVSTYQGGWYVLQMCSLSLWS